MIDSEQPGQDGTRKRSLWKSVLKFGLGGLIAAFVGIQFVPVPAIGNNPEARSTMKGEPPEVVALLKRACFDCHSNETLWPWYSRIAPGSWLMAHDIEEGRKALDYSDWDGLDEEDKQFNREQTRDVVADDEMPPWFYVIPFHAEAKITPQDRALLEKWFADNEEEEEEEEEEKPEKKAVQADGGAPPVVDGGVEPPPEPAPTGEADPGTVAPKKPVPTKLTPSKPSPTKTAPTKTAPTKAAPSKTTPAKKK